MLRAIGRAIYYELWALRWDIPTLFCNLPHYLVEAIKYAAMGAIFVVLAPFAAIAALADLFDDTPRG